MIIDELITDRTQADVDYVETLKAKWLNGTITVAEKAEWLACLKGAYNYTDLNRVGEAVEYLANLLNSSGRHLSVTAKTNWTVYDIPNQAQMNAFLADLTLLKSALGNIDIAVPSSMNNLDFETANRIEQLLVRANQLANYERANWEICGIAVCGVEGAL